MTGETLALMGTAVAIGVVHTLIGPDHYIPFVAMAKARKWSALKTGIITFVCGVGHVGSSVVLGAIGIAVGMAVASLEAFEGHRGDIAGWLLTGFGLAYMVWGVRRAIRNRPHRHVHLHSEGGEHSDGGPHEHVHSHAGEHMHVHSHAGEHVHVHDAPARANITPWILFTIFLFGPCEPLIPLLMYPAAQQSAWGVASVALVFAAATISTMLVIVMALTFALDYVPMGRLERYSHAMAGAAILMCGVAIKMGL
jgi:ABC-type nickel/cobalt efflux system permease component RcnA